MPVSGGMGPVMLGSEKCGPSARRHLRGGQRGSVRSQGEVCRIDPEPVWLVCSGFADELVGREAPQGLEPAGVVVGIQKELEVRLELVVAVVVVAPDGRILEGTV